MTRSFLNLITVDGKQCRLAELGFYAHSPRFDGNNIIFYRDEVPYSFSLESGSITHSAPHSYTPQDGTSPDSRYSIRLEFASQIFDGRGYVHMILKNLSDSTEKVLARFMGTKKSISTSPFSPDSRSVVFFGYPECDDI